MEGLLDVLVSRNCMVRRGQGMLRGRSCVGWDWYEGEQVANLTVLPVVVRLAGWGARLPAETVQVGPQARVLGKTGVALVMVVVHRVLLVALFVAVNMLVAEDAAVVVVVGSVVGVAVAEM